MAQYHHNGIVLAVSMVLSSFRAGRSEEKGRNFVRAEAASGDYRDCLSHFSDKAAVLARKISLAANRVSCNQPANNLVAQRRAAAPAPLLARGGVDWISGRRRNRL